MINDCKCNDCGIKCCGEEMTVIKSNSVDAAVEKHKPTYEIKNDKIHVSVNHVMTEEHYIEWIRMVSNNKEYTFYFKPGDNPIAEFDYIKGSKLYSYCNLHSLWETDVQ